MRTSFPLHAIATLALLAGGLAACSGGGGQDDGGAQAAAEQPGVLRSLTAWAGPPDPGGLGYRDGTGSAARFLGPGRVAVANDGSVYVTELGPRLRRIDAAGQVTTVLDWSSKALDLVVDGRHILVGSPGPMVAAPSGGVFVAMERADGMLGGLPMPGGSWAVVHMAPGLAPQLVALPASESETLTASGLAIDRQGRLHVATQCAIWRSAAEAPGGTGLRPVQKLYEADPASPGQACAPYSRTAISRLALDANDRVLFTLRQGDVKRLEADGQVTTLGRTSAGAGGGMAIDPRGGLLLADGSSALLRLDDAGRESTVAGQRDQPGAVDGSAQVARFGAVSSVAVDRQGRTVVADGDNHTIRRIELDGSVVTIAGRPSDDGYADGAGKDARFSGNFIVGPGGGANILVADSGNAALREVDAAQRVRTLAGGPGTGTYPSTPSPDGPISSTYFGFLTGALRAGDGSVWVADQRSLRRWGTDGVVRTISSASAEEPSVLALDRNGNVIVARSRSAEFGPPLAYLERYSAQNPQAAPERLAIVQPSGGSTGVRGLCALPDGSFVFTQAYAVLRRAADGSVTLLAGSPNQGGAQDGPATVARFNLPTGLACDASGGIYVADSGNNTVRYIDAQRNVRTVLGTPGVQGHRVDALPGELDTPRSLVLVPGGLVVGSRHAVVRAGF
jgi:DNA-binding beta-propeller fold protein YncE